MQIKQVFLMIYCLVDGFRFYHSKLFTHEKLEERVENNIAGILVVGFLISPVLLLFLIKWIINKCSKYYSNHKEQISSIKPHIEQQAKTFQSQNIQNTTIRADKKDYALFYNVCKGLFGLGIIGSIVVAIYAIFIYKPYNPLEFKEYHFKYIIPEGYDNAESDNNNNNNTIIAPEMQYYSAPINNYQSDTEIEEYDNSAWVSYYNENYERMARLVESTYNTLMAVGSGFEYGDGHNGITDNFMGRNKYDLIFQIHQTQKEMSNMRYEAKQKYNITIAQSSWEIADIQ